MGRLRLAWTYRTGTLGRSAPLDPRTGAKLWESDAAFARSGALRWSWDRIPWAARPLR